MAKYRNREVIILEDLPHPLGGQVRIEHVEPGVSGVEIVPRSQVWVTQAEMDKLQEARQKRVDDNDFKILGKDKEPVFAQSTADVVAQKAAEKMQAEQEAQAKADAKVKK